MGGQGLKLRNATDRKPIAAFTRRVGEGDEELDPPRHSPSLVTRSVPCFDHFGESGVRQALRQCEPVHARRLERSSPGPWSIDWLEEQLRGNDEWAALEQTASSQVSDGSAVRHYLFPFVSSACDTTWGQGGEDAARGSMREVRGSSLRALLAGRQCATEPAAARYFRQCLSQPHELLPPGGGAAISWRHAAGVQPGLQAAIEGLDWDALHATISAAAASKGGSVRVRSVQVFVHAWHMHMHMHMHMHGTCMAHALLGTQTSHRSSRRRPAPYSVS